MRPHDSPSAPMALPAFTFDPHPSPVDADERTHRIADPGFGRVFTDHMVTIRYSTTAGWHDARIGPREPLTIDTATARAEGHTSELQSLMRISYAVFCL